MNEDQKVATIAPQKLQMMSVGAAKEWYAKFVEFSKELLVDGKDYGIIPGVAKPSLYKPGAEKLRVAYSLTVLMDEVDKTIDFETGYIDYTYKATVKTKQGQIIAQCEGSFNSWEPKTRYLWVKEDELPEDVDKTTLKVRSGTISEFDFAIDKAETQGQYGKPAEYWQKFKDAIENGTAKKIIKTTRSGKELDAWEIGGTTYRVQNPDIFGLKNTIQKMAQKRAFVGAMLIATGASEFYTQDVEDMDQFNPEAVNEVKTVVTKQIFNEVNITPIKEEPWLEGQVSAPAKPDMVKEAEKVFNTKCTCQTTGKYHSPKCPCYKNPFKDVEDITLPSESPAQPAED
uniref:Uncharacterized protein n=1 Tax=viral metagenome TaxID=1070528 RepID=A0A6M3ISV2_9ZZZZ